MKGVSVWDLLVRNKQISRVEQEINLKESKISSAWEFSQSLVGSKAHLHFHSPSLEDLGGTLHAGVSIEGHPQQSDHRGMSQGLRRDF